MRLVCRACKHEEYMKDTNVKQCSKCGSADIYFRYAVRRRKRNKLHTEKPISKKRVIFFISILIVGFIIIWVGVFIWSNRPDSGGSLGNMGHGILFLVFLILGGVMIGLDLIGGIYLVVKLLLKVSKISEKREISRNLISVLVLFMVSLVLIPSIVGLFLTNSWLPFSGNPSIAMVVGLWLLPFDILLTFLGGIGIIVVVIRRKNLEL